EKHRPKPAFQNTWGDGLFFVFDRIVDAGRFALQLAERIRHVHFEAAGLPRELNLRIALHAGPVYGFADGIIGRRNCIGSHINRAARMEPKTPPGEVYASDAFVALAAVEAPDQFQFDYVGRVPLAKEFGEYPLYHVLPAR